MPVAYTSLPDSSGSIISSVSGQRLDPQYNGTPLRNARYIDSGSGQLYGSLLHYNPTGLELVLNEDGQYAYIQDDGNDITVTLRYRMAQVLNVGPTYELRVYHYNNTGTAAGVGYSQIFTEYALSTVGTGWRTATYTWLNADWTTKLKSLGTLTTVEHGLGVLRSYCAFNVVCVGGNPGDVFFEIDYVSIDPGSNAQGWVVFPDGMDYSPVEFGTLETTDTINFDNGNWGIDLDLSVGTVAMDTPVAMGHRPVREFVLDASPINPRKAGFRT